MDKQSPSVAGPVQGVNQSGKRRSRRSENRSQGAGIGHKLRLPLVQGNAARRGKLLTMLNLSGVVRVNERVMVPDCQCQAFSHRKGMNYFSLKAVAWNHSEAQYQGIKNGKRIFGQRKRYPDKGAARAFFKLVANLFACIFQGRFDFGAQATQNPSDLGSFRRLIAQPLRLVLVPRDPNGYENRRYRADGLHPCGPLIAVQIVSASDDDRCRAYNNGKEYHEPSRSGEAFDFRCHLGILA